MKHPVVIRLLLVLGVFLIPPAAYLTSPPSETFRSAG
jgi:hypothetical protein